MKPSFAYFRAALACSAFAFSLAGCATLPPPTAELSGAQQAITRAEGADADQYASNEISAARDEFSQAQAAMSDGRDDDARRAALQAAADADLAHARSREALAKAELAQRQSDFDTLKQRLSSEPVQ